MDVKGEMAHDPLKLDPQAVEAIARRVAELLEYRAAQDVPGLVDAAELARRMGMERDWVYAHASELGAVRLGAGPKARLRFDPEVAIERMRRRAEGKRPAVPIHRPRRDRRSAPRSGAPLLPIKGSGGSRPFA